MTPRSIFLISTLLALAAVGCEDGADDPSDAAVGPPATQQPAPDASGPTYPSTGNDAGSGQRPSDAATGFSWPDAATIDAAVPRDDAGLPAVPEGAAGEFKFITVDNRMVSVYLPPTKSTGPVPLIFSLHGLSIPAVVMADITQLPLLADKENFVAVFPEGAGGSWNTGGAVCGLGIFVSSTKDDVAFLDKIVVEVQKLRPIDETRMFVSGFSMGGYGTNNISCRNPGRFRAGAPAAGGFPTAPCDPKHIPMIVFHGTSDGTISYDCGVQARDAWVRHNGCSAEVDVKMVTGGKCEWNRNCPADGQVVFCSFDGLGHGWAGSYNPFALGLGPLYESATTLMWDFFKKYL